MTGPKTFLLQSLVKTANLLSPRGKERFAVPILKRVARLLPSGQPVPVKCGLGKVYLDLRELYQAWMAVGIYEVELEELLKKYLAEGDVYFDIGAQLGYTAMQAIGRIGPKGEAVLIDADPRAISGLGKMVRSLPESYHSQVQIVDKVCSDRDGDKLEFELLGVVGHSKVATGMEERCVDKFEVETVSIDTLTRNISGNIRVAKMDVEGHEVSVLKGMKKTLSEGRVEVMIMESNPVLLEWALRSPRDLFVMMTHYGYYGYTMEENLPIDDGMLCSEHLRNFVFCLKQEDLPSDIRSDVVEVTEQFKKKNDVEGEFEKIMKPDSSWKSWLTEAIAFVRHGDLDKGIEQVKQLLEEHPEANDARGHYAHWLLSKGLKEEAIGQYEELSGREPENQEVKRLLEELKAEQ